MQSILSRLITEACEASQSCEDKRNIEVFGGGIKVINSKDPEITKRQNNHQLRDLNIDPNRPARIKLLMSSNKTQTYLNILLVLLVAVHLQSNSHCVD